MVVIRCANKFLLGALVYRPSVYFVYDQQLSAESIKKFVSNKYELLPHNSVVEREVEDGADKLGVLLLGTFYHFTVRCLSPIESARHCSPTCWIANIKYSADSGILR